jgi:uncharacterized protein YkwD
MWRALYVSLVFTVVALPALAAGPDATRVARVIVAETNQARDDAGRDPLVPHVKLIRVAQAFADYLAKSDRFSHRADGSSPAQRARAGGYAWCYIAENIAWESRSLDFESDELAHQLVQDWLSSPGHRQNLLDANMHDIGVGIAYAEKTNRWYAVQVFGRERTGTGC